MEVTINCRSERKTLCVIEAWSETYEKISNLLKEHPNFPGCNAVRFLLAGLLVEVADKKELFKLLLDFFGRTFYLSWKQKSCFVMISL